MTEPEIDTAIDRAVRDLMSVDADGAFRARVTARLERPVRRLGRVSLLMAATAMTAALVAGMLWLRPAPAGRIEPAPVARVESPAPGAPHGTPRAALPPSTAVRTAPTPQRPAVRRLAAMPIARGAVVATVAEAPSSIPPLAALGSIRIETITQTPIAPAAIEVAPLPSIAEVHIAPLEPPSARH